MAYKTFVWTLLVSAVLLVATAEQKFEEYDSHPSYSFNYDVQDAVTGDVKSQSEQREGDVVQGQYALNDADGYRRIVDYTVDAVSGFKATVRREPLGAAPTPAAAQILSQPKIDLVPSAPAPAAPTPAVVSQPLKEQATLKTYTQPAAYIRTYAAPTVLHHAPAHTLIHAAPAVHYAPTAHILHTAPTTTLLKTSPTVIAHHAIHEHHHPAVVKTSFSTPHVSYVY